MCRKLRVLLSVHPRSYGRYRMDFFFVLLVNSDLNNVESFNKLNHGRPYNHSRSYYYNNFQVFVDHDHELSGRRGDLQWFGFGLGSMRRNRLDWLDLLYVARSPQCCDFC